MTAPTDPYEHDDEHDSDPNDIVARLLAKQATLDLTYHDPFIKDTAALLREAAKTIWNLRNGYGG